MWTALLAAAALFPLRRRHYAAPLIAAAALGSGELLRALINHLAHRVRPPQTDWLVHATGSAWPSGHATTALLGSGLILALTWPDLTTRGRRVTATAVVILTAAVGASRVYLGVHWVSDVLGGWSFGALWLTAAIAALSGYHYRRRLKPADPTRDQTSQNR